MPGALFFLSSGLFMGWSLGANDAANIFGTAVATRMVRFRTATGVAGAFILLGAVNGAGAAKTYGQLGAVNALPGAFTVALAAALTVFWMVRAGLAVSTSQAIVGGIMGWNLFAGYPTDMGILYRIMATWAAAPLLGAAFAVLLYLIIRHFLNNTRLHLLRLDRYTRAALLAAGAFGAYSLGLNNIANVMGVFLRVSPFQDLNLTAGYTFTAVQQLFLLGGAAMALGVLTYSRKVMLTVGSGIYALSPVTAFIVVLAASLVLFIFGSQSLQSWLVSLGLPSLPLVPVSQSQAVVGAIAGIGLARGGRNINFRLLGKIGLGWIATPVAAALLAYLGLFFMQNVFQQPVFFP
jgi:inorganic phosphate transporter, PiT family